MNSDMVELVTAGYRRISDEVYYAPPPPCSVTPAIVAKLGALAASNPSGKARICFHADPDASLHDMLIALDRKAKMLPHLHLQKIESFQIISGEMQINFYNENGQSTGDVKLSATAGVFYFRIPAKIAHAVTPLTDLVIFREITDGPFRAEDTIYPAWITSLESK